MSFDPKLGGVPVYCSRYGLKRGQGDLCAWEKGERATFVAKDGQEHPVTIASYFCKGEGSGDDLCLEVTFDDEGGAKWRVRAKQLEPRGGFPPYSPG